VSTERELAPEWGGGDIPENCRISDGVIGVST
jgi:hypothetical protein